MLCFLCLIINSIGFKIPEGRKRMKNYFVQIVVTEYYTFNILAEKNTTEFLAVKIICVC